MKKLIIILSTLVLLFSIEGRVLSADKPNAKQDTHNNDRGVLEELKDFTDKGIKNEEGVSNIEKTKELYLNDSPKEKNANTENQEKELAETPVPKSYHQYTFLPEFIYNVENNSFLKSPNTYVNKSFGFAFDKNGFFVDDSKEDIKTTFYTGYTYVDIFYDSFYQSNASSNAYINYSNKFFWNNEYVTVESDNTYYYARGKARVIKWNRKPLKHAKEDGKDFTYYALIDIEKNPNEIYTIQINSVSEIQPLDYISRFKLFPNDWNHVMKYAQVNRKVNAKWSEATKNYYDNDFKNPPRTELGIFEPTTAYYFDKLHGMEEKQGIKFRYLLEYYSFADTLYQHHFDELYKDGRILELTFQTSFGNELLQNMTYDVLDGKYDNKIIELAKVLKNTKGPVLFRLNNEMNGDWCSYNALHFNRDTRLYTKMWQHFKKTIEDLGADNVIFVFNPNEKSFPDFKWNHFMNYFPGEDSVDVIGVTGYNTGNYYYGEQWRDFKSIYDEFMPEYKSRFLGYDFFITEFGSSTYGGDRIPWLDDMFQKLNDYGFKVAIYWNGIDWDGNGNPARRYKITDDDEAMKHIREYKSRK